MGLSNRRNVDSLYSTNTTANRQALEFNRRATTVNTATATSNDSPPKIASLTLRAQVQGVKVQWADPNYSVREYEIEVSNKASFTGTKDAADHSTTDYAETFFVAAPALVHLLPALDADVTLYYARIRVRGMSGDVGPWSNVASTSVASVITDGDVLTGEITEFSAITDATWTALNNSNGGSVNSAELTLSSVPDDAWVIITVTIDFAFASIWNSSASVNNMDIELRVEDEGTTPVAIGGDHTLLFDFKSTLPTDIAGWGGGSPADTQANIITVQFAPHQPGAEALDGPNYDYDVLVRTDTDAAAGSGAELYLLINDMTIDASVVKA